MSRRCSSNARLRAGAGRFDVQRLGSSGAPSRSASSTIGGGDARGQAHGATEPGALRLRPQGRGRRAGRVYGADEVRPLALKNIGVKIATAVISRAVGASISASTSLLQKAFVAGRSFVGNNWTLDAYLREWSRRVAVEIGVSVEDWPALLALGHPGGLPERRPVVASCRACRDGRATRAPELCGVLVPRHCGPLCDGARLAASCSARLAGCPGDALRAVGSSPSRSKPSSGTLRRASAIQGASALALTTPSEQLSEGEAASVRA